MRNLLWALVSGVRPLVSSCCTKFYLRTSINFKCTNTQLVVHLFFMLMFLLWKLVVIPICEINSSISCFMDADTLCGLS